MDEKKILFSTSNEGKAREFKKILRDFPLEVLTLNDFNFNKDIPETGSTYEENATIKAKKGAEISGLVSIGDDTGMEIEALNGFPGLYSKRFAGGSEEDRNKLILDKLKDIPKEKRAVKYVGVIAVYNFNQSSFERREKGFYNPETEEVKIFRGELKGMIISEPRGENGFGYDPIFYLPECKKTVAELSQEEKNKISHRGKALLEAKKYLKELMSL